MYLNKMCRTCLCSGTEMRSLFDEVKTLEKELPSAAEILRIFTSISIDNKDDNLPNHICIGCFNEIHRTYSFKLKCEKSESILFELKKTKVDSIKMEADLVDHTKSEIPDLYGDDALITKNKAKLSEISSNSHCVEESIHDFEVIFKHEPELDVDVNDEGVGCVKTELKDDEESPEIVNGPIETNRIQKNTLQVGNEEFEITTNLRRNSVKRSNYNCTQLDPLPTSRLEESTNETSSHLYQDLTTHPDYIEEIKVEPIVEDTTYQSEYEEELDDFDETTFPCSICPFVKFDAKELLDRHNQRLHTDLFGIKCFMCSVKFAKQTEFMLHMNKIHNCEKPYECELCGSHYQTKPALNHHLRAKHPQEISAVNVFECEICSKILPYKAKYIEHMRSHTSTKSFQCKLCLEKFRYRYSLKSHMRRKHVQEFNDGKPDYQCSVCSKIFGFQYNLASHMRIHTREEPFQCKVCSSKFRHSQSLRCHMRRKHADELTGGKPEYQCNICSKIFGFNNRLMRHMHIHTGEKPYHCKHCSEKFRYSYALKSHVERSHPNEVVGTDQ